MGDGSILKLLLKPGSAIALVTAITISNLVPIGVGLEGYRGILNLIGLFFLMICVTYWWRYDAENRKILADLKWLSPDERRKLAKHIKQKQRTLNWERNPAIESLLAKGLLEIVSGEHNGVVPCSVPWRIWKRLVSKKDLIATSTRRNPQRNHDMSSRIKRRGPKLT